MSWYFQQLLETEVANSHLTLSYENNNTNLENSKRVQTSSNLCIYRLIIVGITIVATIQ